MPLGTRQNNDFTQFTMDVWNDKIFYQEKEFSAGFMAMSILNIPEEKLPELIQAGGAPTFLFPVVVQGSDEEAAAVFPQLRERILYLTELLWKYPPFATMTTRRKCAGSISCLTREHSHKYGYPIRSSRQSS